MKKKVLSVILSLALVIGLVPQKSIAYASTLANDTFTCTSHVVNFTANPTDAGTIELSNDGTELTNQEYYKDTIIEAKVSAVDGYVIDKDALKITYVCTSSTTDDSGEQETKTVDASNVVLSADSKQLTFSFTMPDFDSDIKAAFSKQSVNPEGSGSKGEEEQPSSKTEGNDTEDAYIRFYSPEKFSIDAERTY